MNLHCDKRCCSHNSGFEYSCMYGISEDLIRHAKSGNSMCEHLKKQILELEELFCKDMMERIVERLEEKNMSLVDSANIAYNEFTNGTINGFELAIEIVKEGKTNE